MNIEKAWHNGDKAAIAAFLAGIQEYSLLVDLLEKEGDIDLALDMLAYCPSFKGDTSPLFNYFLNVIKKMGMIKDIEFALAFTVKSESMYAKLNDLLIILSEEQQDRVINAIYSHASTWEGISKAIVLSAAMKRSNYRAIRMLKDLPITEKEALLLLEKVTGGSEIMDCLSILAKVGNKKTWPKIEEMAKRHSWPWVAEKKLLQVASELLGRQAVPILKEALKGNLFVIRSTAFRLLCKHNIREAEKWLLENSAFFGSDGLRKAIRQMGIYGDAKTASVLLALLEKVTLDYQVRIAFVNALLRIEENENKRD